MALWDIKGKLAGMPLYQLLGGKCREAAAVYTHADGRDVHEVEDNVRAFMEQGYHYIRCQMGGYGGRGHRIKKPDNALPGAYFDPEAYAMSVPSSLSTSVKSWDSVSNCSMTSTSGSRRIEAVRLAKQLEPYRLFFLEDPLAPEDLEWFEMIRGQCATPIAMGELFNNPREWVPLIANRLIDFIRIHISQIGGLTPARKLAAFAEQFHVRTAWHGPGDLSPVGVAANIHLDVSCPNFRIQEYVPINEQLQEVFPGCPEMRNGYVYPNDRPGLGIDIDEEKAAKFPCSHALPQWTLARKPDGTATRP